MKEITESFSRVNLYEQIADYIEKKILFGGDPEWKAGMKLPPEQDLADTFHVSRNVVREAVKVLKERGLVEPRNGVGVIITRPDDQIISAGIYRLVLMEEMSVETIYDVRMLIESYTARKAAENATDEMLSEMRALLDRMEDTSLSVNERREYDFLFHVEIAKAAGNKLMEILVVSLKDVFLAMIEKGIVIFGGIDDAQTRHEKILHAIAMHNPDLAAKAMEEHIAYSLKHVRKYEEEHGLEKVPGLAI